MKKAIALLIAFTLFGFSNIDKPDLKLMVTKVQPLDNGKFNVALELQNNSSQKISYLSMYCSYSGFYQTDHSAITIIPKPCDKNFPIKVTIAKNSYRTTTLDLQLAKATKSAQFKIGFKFIEIPENVMLSEFDSTTVKSVTIWSNAMELRNR